jgi:hypothetical protein
MKFKKEEVVLIVLMSFVYLFKTPIPLFLAKFIYSVFGVLIGLSILYYLGKYTSPILTIVATFVFYDLFIRSKNILHLQFIPSEYSKNSQLNAFNQFPYTLEQEIVSKMAPIHKSFDLSTSHFKPNPENTHHATSINLNPS